MRTFISEKRKSKTALSIVMPCLNEAATIEMCVREALRIIKILDVNGEVIVVDNASTDDSAVKAKAAGARVVYEPRRGYGRAIRSGIRAAIGEAIVILDADMTYDFSDIPKVYQPLRMGVCDMVIGDRFAGGMERDAMSLLHRIGVKVLSFIGRLKFDTDVMDFHCGLRGITRAKAEKLHFETEGMEFATEMIAEAARNNLRIGQVRVRLLRCRYNRVSKLRTFRDGFRHLIYMLRL